MTASGPRVPGMIAAYRLGRAIGGGPAGQVFEATDTRTGAAVAVKLFWPQLAGDSGFRARFEREMKVARELAAPEIARVLDYGYSAGWYYVAMERPGEQSLAARLKEGPLDPGEAAAIGLDIARALAAAASQNIVHGDLKPENVILAPDGSAKVIDFGMARVLGGRGSDYLPAGAEARSPDPRSDVYALGAMLREMVAGPVDGDGGEPGPLPPAIAAVVERCLGDPRVQRAPTASEVVALLEPEAQRAALRGLAGTLQEAPRAAAEALDRALEKTMAPAPAARSTRPAAPAAVRGQVRDLARSPAGAGAAVRPLVTAAAGAAARSGPATAAALVGSVVVLVAVIGLVAVASVAAIYVTGEQLALDPETATVSEVLSRDEDADTVFGLHLVAALATWPVLAWFGWAFTRPVRERLGGNPLTRTAGTWSWLVPLVNAVYPFYVLDRAARERGMSGIARAVIWGWCLASLGGYGMMFAVLGIDPEGIETVYGGRDELRVIAVLYALIGAGSVYAAIAPVVLLLAPKRGVAAEPSPGTG